MEDLKCSLEMLGWANEVYVVEKLEGLTVSEVGQMLKDCAWREVKKGWMTEAQERSKLSVLQNLMEGGGKARCLQIERKGLRRILSKLRGDTAGLRLETSRWMGIKQEDRICVQCNSGEVEDLELFLLRCSCVDSEREVLTQLMNRTIELVDDFQDW